MARCRVGPKKVARYRAQTGLDVLSAFVRGNTGHRIDLLLADGSIASWYPDGTIEKDETASWDVAEWKATHQQK